MMANNGQHCLTNEEQFVVKFYSKLRRRPHRQEDSAASGPGRKVWSPALLDEVAGTVIFLLQTVNVQFQPEVEEAIVFISMSHHFSERLRASIVQVLTAGENSIDKNFFLTVRLLRAHLLKASNQIKAFLKVGEWVEKEWESLFAGSIKRVIQLLNLNKAVVAFTKPEITAKIVDYIENALARRNNDEELSLALQLWKAVHGTAVGYEVTDLGKLTDEGILRMLAFDERSLLVHHSADVRVHTLELMRVLNFPKLENGFFVDATNFEFLRDVILMQLSNGAAEVRAAAFRYAQAFAFYFEGGRNDGLPAEMYPIAHYFLIPIAESLMNNRDTFEKGLRLNSHPGRLMKLVNNQEVLGSQMLSENINIAVLFAKNLFPEPFDVRAYKNVCYGSYYRGFRVPDGQDLTTTQVKGILQELIKSYREIRSPQIHFASENYTWETLPGHLNVAIMISRECMEQRMDEDFKKNDGPRFQNAYCLEIAEVAFAMLNSIVTPDFVPSPKSQCKVVIQKFEAFCRANIDEEITAFRRTRDTRILKILELLVQLIFFSMPHFPTMRFQFQHTIDLVAPCIQHLLNFSPRLAMRLSCIATRTWYEICYYQKSTDYGRIQTVWDQERKSAVQDIENLNLQMILQAKWQSRNPFVFRNEVLEKVIEFSFERSDEFVDWCVMVRHIYQ